VKYIDILKVVAEISTLIGTKNAKGQTNQCPDVNRIIFAAKMVRDIMYLRMTIMAAGNAVIGPCRYDLVEFNLTIRLPCFGETRLEETSTTAATVVVGFIGCHFYQILFTDYRFYDKSEIIRHRIAVALADNLAGILNGEFDFSVLIPL